MRWRRPRSSTFPTRHRRNNSPRPACALSPRPDFLGSGAVEHIDELNRLSLLVFGVHREREFLAVRGNPLLTGEQQLATRLINPFHLERVTGGDLRIRARRS